ncbi:MAG: CCA tRNA nucleotidyltransferase [Phycisphaeraceae bacterium]|nr:MAG: CCA tRNA nucleotidyltransferase [Phycisphaeraceae bacterium]
MTPGAPEHGPSPRDTAASIVRTLREAGHLAYFAGGCVRDEILGRTPDDYDVATDAVPDRVRSLFRKTAAVGAHFGVVLVKSGGVVVEVATFRADGAYTDARRPDSVRFSSPLEDAQRRDYTVNALFLDPLAPPQHPPGLGPVRGAVIDLVGGLDDLRARRLRAVGDPDQRLTEDHLRALRAVRLASKLGFTIDPPTAAAITRHAAELRGVSRERIGDEIRMILSLPSRAAAITLLTSLALDASALTEPHAPTALARLEALGPGETPFPLALAAWARDRGLARDEAATRADADRWRRALCLSNDETVGLRTILSTRLALESSWARWTIPEKKRAASGPWFAEGLSLYAAESPGPAAEVRDEVDRLSRDGVGLAPRPLVTGEDLIAAGLTPGPRFRSALERIYDAQLAGEVRDRATALELVRGLIV